MTNSKELSNLTPADLIQIIQAKENDIAILKSSNDYLRNIITVIPGNIFWKDAEGKFLGCNLNNARILGFSLPEDLIGKKNADLMDEKLAYMADQNDAQAMKTATEIYCEEVGYDIAKQPAVYLTKKISLRNTEGEPIGLLGVSFDITDRKKIEKALQLEKEKVDRASQSKSDFIANMSHDIKTPLSGIIGLAELLMDDVKDQQSHFLLGTIFLASQQLLKMFDNYLASFKANKDEKMLFEDFELKSIINEIYELNLPAVKVKNLGLIIDYDASVPEMLHGNKIALYRILVNLIGNAIKFTHDGSVTIQVKTEKILHDQQKAIIEIIISDTGIGIPADKQNIIFEKFTRLTPSSKGLFEGSGMGLYIVKNDVAAMEGSLFIKSEEGKGSQFIVHLPLQIKEVSSSKFIFQSNIAAMSTYISAPKSKKVIHHQLKILLVEDNQIAQLVAYSMLSSLNCYVEVANSGEAALTLIEKNLYDLILLDIGLPGKQGDEIALDIRKMEKNRERCIPIVALTAHAAFDNTQYADSGIDNILIKPISKQQVEEVISGYFIWGQA